MLIVWAFIILGIVLILGARFLRHYAASNTSKYITSEEYFFVHTGDNYRTVLKRLQDGNVVDNVETFDWMARQLGYPEKIHPGRYKIEPGMSNIAMVNLLRSGKQEPVNLVIGKYRLNRQFRVFVAKHIEADSIQLQYAFDSIVSARQMDTQVVQKDMMGYVIPNTYQFYWNTSAPQFWDKILSAYAKFWNSNRLAAAKRLGLTPYEVITMASIVEEETNKEDEKPVIAGVYLNRLRKNMLLQADPTVRYALSDFSIKRILFKHLKFESDYNTYQKPGLPPGPICIPSIKSIDAVLFAQQHNYLYFCAREDFSGYHNFTADYKQHELNAKKYQQALTAYNAQK